ncbi:DUF493 domain-containing protein [Granulosicoccaceae sp. 1_MG-2023]|nr:DUF493 domain-containing protein [Granulosicoccaceae sp. 1_MG-2023]
MSDTPQEQETLLEFPCEFSIKAMGKAEEDFLELVESLVSPHLEDDSLQTRQQHSGKGNYTSVTVTFTAVSKQQLDRVYLSLTGHERLLYVL